MWPAFPASDYYGGSAPCPACSADDVPSPSRPRWQRGRGARPGRFPCSPIDRSTKEAPGYTPAASPQLTRSTSLWPPEPSSTNHPEVPRHQQPRCGCAPLPAQIRQVRAGGTLGGFTHRFLAYTSPSRSPDPHHLAVLIRPGFVGAACHPPRHLPAQAAPSFTALLRQDSGEGLPPPLDQSALHGARATGATGPRPGRPAVRRRWRLRRRTVPGPGR